VENPAISVRHPLSKIEIRLNLIDGEAPFRARQIAAIDFSLQAKITKAGFLARLRGRHHQRFTTA
jgi:hypothetical protein